MEKAESGLKGKIDALIYNKDFWDKVTKFLSIVEPIVKVLHMVDGDKSHIVP